MSGRELMEAMWKDARELLTDWTVNRLALLALFRWTVYLLCAAGAITAVVVLGSMVPEGVWLVAVFAFLALLLWLTILGTIRDKLDAKARREMKRRGDHDE